jgi:hypothetical protein
VVALQEKKSVVCTTTESKLEGQDWVKPLEPLVL